MKIKLSHNSWIYILGVLFIIKNGTEMWNFYWKMKINLIKCKHLSEFPKILSYCEGYENENWEFNICHEKFNIQLTFEQIFKTYTVRISVPKIKIILSNKIFQFNFCVMISSFLLHFENIFTNCKVQIGGSSLLTLLRNFWLLLYSYSS